MAHSIKWSPKAQELWNNIVEYWINLEKSAKDCRIPKTEGKTIIFDRTKKDN